MKKHFIYQFVLVAFGVVTVLLPHFLFAQVGAVNGACGAQCPA